MESIENVLLSLHLELDESGDELLGMVEMLFVTEC